VFKPFLKALTNEQQIQKSKKKLSDFDIRNGAYKGEIRVEFEVAAEAKELTTLQASEPSKNSKSMGYTRQPGLKLL